LNESEVAFGKELKVKSKKIPLNYEIMEQILQEISFE